MFLDYISAAILIFFAEMGDKTQFLAMAFATKYPTKKILMGVAIGSFINHGLAMVLGKGLLTVMPKDMISFAAGLMFIFFAFQSLKVDSEAIEENKSKFGPIFTVALAFFIGELGDKTQLAALGLAIDSSALIFSLLGTVTGMILTSSIGIFVGLKLGRRVPEDKLKLSAFVIFIVFGVQKLYTSYLNQLNLIVLLGLVMILISVITIAYKRFVVSYSQLRETGFKLQAEMLKSTREKVELKVLDMCRGKESCGVCDENQCLVGHMKELIGSSEGIINKKTLNGLKDLKNKEFSYDEAKSLWKELLDYYDKYPSEYNDNELFTEIRKSVEIIMFKHLNSQKDYQSYKEEMNEMLN